MKFEHDDSGNCAHIYRLLEINRECLRHKKLICRMVGYGDSVEWNSWTNGELDTPLRDGLIIEVTLHDGSVVIDMIKKMGEVTAIGTVKFSFSWE